MCFVASRCHLSKGETLIFLLVDSELSCCSSCSHSKHAMVISFNLNSTPLLLFRLLSSSGTSVATGRHSHCKRVVISLRLGCQFIVEGNGMFWGQLFNGEDGPAQTFP